MDERIRSFIEILKKRLEDLPVKETSEAVSYYEEYLNDAAEAGKDIDKIILQLGSPEEIAASIKAETSITQARRNPGIKNFARVMSYAFHGLTTPFSYIGISIFVIIAYCLVFTFFAGASAILIGAAATIYLAIFEASSIPSVFALEIAGTIGIGLLLAGICLFVSLGLFKLGRLMIIASANVIQHLHKKSAVKSTDENVQKNSKRKKSKRMILILSTITATGFIMFLASGLPYRYFIIFNSMNVQNTTVRTMEYSTDQINRISVSTAHSYINLRHGESNKITVSYVQPDWLDYKCGVNSGVLSFVEKSNGRLSFFKLISFHESLTEVDISVPKDYKPESITLESTGGHIILAGISDSLQVKTYTGDISLTNTGIEEKPVIQASTGSGNIVINEHLIERKSGQVIKYSNNISSGKIINLNSSRGNIYIITDK